MPERITRQVRLSQSSSRFVTPTWILFSSLTENCLASGCHISKSQRLLNLLRAPREVDWERHLSAKRQMVLWCFAYDDLNYSRYLSADLSNVSHAPRRRSPEAWEYLTSRAFSVQLGKWKWKPFGKIPIDQACKETVNKDTQSVGAPRGSILKQSASTIWLPNTAVSYWKNKGHVRFEEIKFPAHRSPEY